MGHGFASGREKEIRFGRQFIQMKPENMTFPTGFSAGQSSLWCTGATTNFATVKYTLTANHSTGYSSASQHPVALSLKRESPNVL